MSRSTVLDSEAVSVLAGKDPTPMIKVFAMLDAAIRLRHQIIVPALVLAELYRGAARSAQIDALLARQPGWVERPTDRWFARLVGGLLHAAGAGSELMVDAHVAAAAIEAGGGVVLTADPDDLERLAAPYVNVAVVDIS